MTKSQSSRALSAEQIQSLFVAIHLNGESLEAQARKLGMRRSTLNERLLRAGFVYGPTLRPLTKEASKLIGIPIIQEEPQNDSAS